MLTKITKLSFLGGGNHDLQTKMEGMRGEVYQLRNPETMLLAKLH
jgi:hypothetical protein